MANNKNITKKNKTGKILKYLSKDNTSTKKTHDNNYDEESAISKAREILNKTRSLDKAKLALIRQAKFNSFKLFGFD
jgi:hypothetical protein